MGPISVMMLYFWALKHKFNEAVPRIGKYIVLMYTNTGYWLGNMWDAFKYNFVLYYLNLFVELGKYVILGYNDNMIGHTAAYNIPLGARYTHKGRHRLSNNE